MGKLLQPNCNQTATKLQQNCNKTATKLQQNCNQDAISHIFVYLFAGSILSGRTPIVIAIIGRVILTKEPIYCYHASVCTRQLLTFHSFPRKMGMV